MSSALFGNYVSGNRQLTIVKVDMRSSLKNMGFFLEKNEYVMKQSGESFNVCVHHVPIYRYLKSFRNCVHNLSDNMHVPSKIYLEFYHSIVHIANERRHIRIVYCTYAVVLCLKKWEIYH